VLGKSGGERGERGVYMRDTTVYLFPAVLLTSTLTAKVTNRNYSITTTLNHVIFGVFRSPCIS